MANPKAQGFKEKGNAAFKAGDYPTAIGHYTSSILADTERKDATFALNRAAAYLKLGKYEDTERDCNTVLAISAPKSNVKALFRRGQARVGLGKLLEAQKDFTDVLAQEPANTSASDELKAVTALIQKEKAKKSRALPSSIPSPSTTSPPEVKRRRVPIRIVGDTPAKSSTTINASGGSTSKSATSTVPKPSSASSKSHSTKAKIVETNLQSNAMAIDSKNIKTSLESPASAIRSTPPPGASDDMLQAVSSRSLKSTTPSAKMEGDVPSPPASNRSQPSKSSPILAPTTSASTPPTPAPEAQPNPKPKPDSFKDAKQARDAKSPRVGGGIFRASGPNTIFASRGGAGSDANADSSSAGKDSAASGSGTAETEIVSPSVDQTSVPGSKSTTASTAAAGAQSTSEPSPPFKEPLKNAQPPPTTLFEFSKTWYGLKSPWEKWEFLNNVPPTQFPGLCKTSLEPSLLVSILDILLTVLTSSPDTPEAVRMRVQEYMDNFSHISRFTTLVLFLSKPEKEVAREVWEALGVDRPAGVWKAVASK